MAEYVYCIMLRNEVPENFSVNGIEEGRVYAIPYSDIAAIASKTEMKEFDPSEENINQHKRVELYFLQNHTVLPVAFGMVFRTRGILIQTMRNVYALLKKSLRLVENKIELGVKATLPAEFLDERKKEELRKKCEEDFVAMLNKLSVHAKNGKLFSEKLAFNGYFLVERERIEDFSAAVGSIVEKYKELKIKYSGPWPPYNFVDIRIMARGR